MNKEQQNQKTEQVISAQQKASQFSDQYDTEFSTEESVQQAIAKSQQFQAENQQPTYEANKPF